METPVAMFKNLCKEIEIEFIKANLSPKKKQENVYKIILLNLVNIITKLGIMKPTLVCFMTNCHIL